MPLLIKCFDSEGKGVSGWIDSLLIETLGILFYKPKEVSMEFEDRSHTCAIPVPSVPEDTKKSVFHKFFIWFAMEKDTMLNRGRH